MHQDRNKERQGSESIARKFHIAKQKQPLNKAVLYVPVENERVFRIFPAR